MPEHALFEFLDLAGIFVFAISGAAAARERDLDLFGIVALAFVTACGGGIVRDLCLGALPPVGLADWRYLACATLGALATLGAYGWVRRLRYPVLLFDAVGMAMFAVAGTQKALGLGRNAETAVLLGMMTAVGGGILRDMLLSRVAVVLEREIYASAALLGSLLVVVGDRFHWGPAGTTWPGLLACFGLRYLSLRFGWNMPRFGRREAGSGS
ncbi:trimeric intracellular cation channel family protein [Geothrix fuzhouensis]|uniref:trimeric intracellular cation channel family protein n=1 Tax=Geothrix fuzhouensis TaxID=2966451 RepID=UPI0021491F26|nr:trimeric intracellular cation channel family protein [Geothrix fuzhouensis]